MKNKEEVLVMGRTEDFYLEDERQKHAVKMAPLIEPHNREVKLIQEIIQAIMVKTRAQPQRPNIIWVWVELEGRKYISWSLSDCSFYLLSDGRIVELSWLDEEGLSSGDTVRPHQVVRLNSITVSDKIQYDLSDMKKIRSGLAWLARVFGIDQYKDFIDKPKITVPVVKPEPKKPKSLFSRLFG